MKRAMAALAMLAVLAAAAALATLFQSGRPPAKAAHPLRIGVSLGLTGRYASMAAMQEQGFRLWAEQQNAAGGLHDRQVELLVRDDAGEPAQALALYRDFILRERVDFLFAPYSSELTRAVAALAAEHGHPLLCPGATADGLWDADNPLLFGVFTPAGRYAQGFLELLLQHGVTRLALLTFPGMFPEEASRGVRAWASRLGLEVVVGLHVTGSPGRVAEAAVEAVIEARVAGAEALLVCGYAQDAETVRRAAHAAGWRPRAFFATIGPCLDGYQKHLGPLAEGDFSTALWEPGLPHPGAAEFTGEFTARFGRQPSYHAAGAYAAGQILAEAVAAAGSTERRKVADTLGTLSTTTILGHYGVDQRGMQNRHFPVVVQWQAGRKAVVWPRELATAEPRFF